MTLSITELLTTVNKNTANRGKADINYVVIHYVGATGGAKANCTYFQKVNRGASAHLFVGHEGEIYRCVPDKDIAWHCGTSGKYYHSSCRNVNSIGIELCCRQKSDGTWYFEDATIKSAIELTKEYMDKYDIPIDNVIRHYDVTRKSCPAPYCGSAANDKAWAEFKAKLTSVSKPAKPNTSTSTSTNTKPNDKSVKVKGAVSHIREKAQIASKILKKNIAIDTELIWLSDDNWGWSKVRHSDGTTGYIQNSRLSGKTGLSTWRIGTITGNGVRVRTKPSAKAGKVIRSLNKGMTFNIICYVPSQDKIHPKDWAVIHINGTDYYIYSQYVKAGARRSK